jgi:hypothetical protein
MSGRPAGLALALCCLSSGPLLAGHTDGILLTISSGAQPDEVVLQWTGGQPAFKVYRSTDPGTVVDPPNDQNVIGTPSERSFVDTPPPGSIFFYEITSPCVYAPPEVCDGADNDCNGTVDEPGTELTCMLPNAAPACSDGSCAIASCNTGFEDCNNTPADGCETNINVAQSTTPIVLYPGGVKAGYDPVATIANCGGCGITCDDGNSCTTELCVPGVAGAGQCRVYDRAQCSEARCGGAPLPPDTPQPFEPECIGQDADGDGLPSQWEVPQTDPYTDSVNLSAGVDLNCDGEISDGNGDLIWHEPPAGDSIKDIYLELDYMSGGGFISDPILGVIQEPYSDHSLGEHPVTGKSVVTEVRDAFAREGISLHVDVSAQALPHHQMVYMPTSPEAPPECSQAVDPVTGEPVINFHAYKSNPDHHDPRRRLFYHYAISGHSACVDSGETDGSGGAEVCGNDAVVSLGATPYYVVAPSGTLCASDFDCCPNCSPNLYTCVLPSGVCVSNAEKLRRYREGAGTMMHELGHNLGLCHDGLADLGSSPLCTNANKNYAPNHISSMNYAFQLAWIFRSATPGTISPLDLSLPRRIDFSHGVEMSLDEAALDETLGLNVTTQPFSRDITQYYCQTGFVGAPSFGPIDWNCDGNIGGIVSADINNDGMIGSLPSSDQWGGLRLDFQCTPSVRD